MNKIVFMDGDIPSTYFPVGRPEDGGTCAYATEACLEACPSSQVTNLHEVKALHLFKTRGVKWLVRTILEELDEEKVFQWHVWGDCLPELTGKCAAVMIELQKAGINQFGFTRNKPLWELVSAAGIRMGLSVDSEAEAIEMSQRGLVCWPDVDRSEARLHWKWQMVARCSGWWCTYIPTGEMHNSACRRCIIEKKGCFQT